MARGAPGRGDFTIANRPVLSRLVDDATGEADGVTAALTAGRAGYECTLFSTRPAKAISQLVGRSPKRYSSPVSSGAPDTRSRAGRDSATRQALIDATAQIMLDEGYAAATSRRLAAKAGVKPALVHYYFPSMDDLFVAVLRDRAETNLQHQRQAIAEAKPLHALWQLTSAHDAQLFTEFLAMANHRKAIRSEISSYITRFRDLEEGAMTLALKARGIDLEAFPPVVVSMIMASLARMVLHEQGLGITRGHDQAKAFIEQCLDRFEMPSWNGIVTQIAQVTQG